MKNNLSISKITLIILLQIIFLSSFVSAQEINFKAEEILAYKEGNLIVGKGKAEAIINGELEIQAEKITYDKKKEHIIAEGKVFIFDILNNIKVNSEKVDYKKNINQIISYDKTLFNIENKYDVTSSDVYFNINKSIITSKKFTTVKDNSKNYIQVSSFKYSNNTKILDGKDIELVDNEQNSYFVELGKVDLKNQKLLGKDVKILLRNDSFGNPDNEPKLKGNSIDYENDKTRISKGIFTSCKENNNCPPWSITSKEIIHYKNKKEIHYKNAWLKLYNTPVMYFPKFFHPDPTVDRKSGFLMPTFGDSKNLGASVNLPYFHVISESEDFTFKPRFFSNTEYLLQSEFRKEGKNSSHIADFSINKTDDDSTKGRKTHFFSNSTFKLNSNFFDESDVYIKIEKVSNDDYTRLYSLDSTSPIIKDTSVLENLVQFSGYNNDFNLELSFESYETMNKSNNDRYEFVYPNYSLEKSLNFENNIINTLNFSSSGNQKKIETNVYEATQINDFLVSSKDFINKLGFNNKFKTIFKNVNTDGKNSSKLKDDPQSEVLSIFSFDTDFPLIKESSSYKNFLTPKFSLRYSPNDTKNLKDEDRLINTDNLFSLNRIGFGETIEGGSSLTLGLDYEKKNKENNNTIFSSSIGTVFRDEINENLPLKSTLGKKQSDFVGQINFNPNQTFQIDYNYMINDNLDEFNFHKLKNTLNINNFVNTFTFYEENNLIGKKSYYENNFSYKIDENNSLSFKTRENKTDNLTEYYNLIYEYKNDCLTASIRYNKEYYSSSTAKPSEELFFNITLVPLGSTQTESILE